MEEMKQPDFDAADRKIQKVIVGKWFTRDPIMLNIMCMLKREPNPAQQTIGLDVRGNIPRLLYNPNWVMAVSEEALECILASEGFKVLLRHCTTRLLEPRQISGLASSVTVCQLMNSDLKNIVAGIDDFLPTPQTYGLKHGQFFEHYFRKLLEKQNEVTEKIKAIWNSMSDEEKENLINSFQSQTQCDCENPEQYKEYKNEKDAVKDYFDPQGTSNLGWGNNNLFDADIKNFVDKHKLSGKGWGKFSGNAIDQIVAANEPKISYKEIVRKFGRSVTTFETISTRMRVNRRYDLAMPGRRRKLKTKIIFSVDVSGSMSNDELAEGFAIINSVFKHAEVIFVQFDVKIQSVERDIKRARRTFEVHGRGGTSFDHVCQMADEEVCDGLVIFTDGEAGPPKQPNCKVLWLMSARQFKPPVEWGMVAHLERNEDTHYF